MTKSSNAQPRNRAIILTLLGLSLAASPVSAKTWLTAKELAQNPDGYSIDLGRGQKAQILEIRAPRGKGTECRVHLPSVKKGALKARHTQAGPVWVPLKYHGPDYDPNSAVLPGSCYGSGTGCAVLVAVP